MNLETYTFAPFVKFHLDFTMFRQIWLWCTSARDYTPMSRAKDREDVSLIGIGCFRSRRVSRRLGLTSRSSLDQLIHPSRSLPNAFYWSAKIRMLGPSVERHRTTNHPYNVRCRRDLQRLGSSRKMSEREIVGPLSELAEVQPKTFPFSMRSLCKEQPAEEESRRNWGVSLPS